jgi:hypothetical protein
MEPCLCWGPGCTVIGSAMILTANDGEPCPFADAIILREPRFGRGSMLIRETLWQVRLDELANGFDYLLSCYSVK